MPAPDDAPVAALQAHVDGCGPCRAELEGLREVDRRVQRLGAYVLLAMPSLMVQLDRRVSQSLGAESERSRGRPRIDNRSAPRFALSQRIAARLSIGRRRAPRSALDVFRAVSGPTPTAMAWRILPIWALLLVLALLGVLLRR